MYLPSSLKITSKSSNEARSLILESLSRFAIESGAQSSSSRPSVARRRGKDASLDNSLELDNSFELDSGGSNQFIIY